MDRHQQLIAGLAEPEDTKIVLLVLDGVGDIRTASRRQTPLEAAKTPHLDALAARASTGRITPVAPGVTPGSGPGHLALFGYDPTSPEAEIGRGVLEALGLGLDIAPGTLTARGNFATAGADGKLTDRRAGRIPTAECVRLAEKLNRAIAARPDLPVEATVHAGEAHRFVLLLRGPNLRPELADTDPQELGEPPLAVTALRPEAAGTAERVAALVAVLEAAIADEPKANRVLLRGFSMLPHLPSFGELYHLRAAAFAGYPLYRGVASACGMEVVPCGKRFGDALDAIAKRWSDFDYGFIHVKQTDQSGEDGDFDAKVAVIEEVDAALPRLLDLRPDVLAITGDHSTPVAYSAHSWHPVPLLLWSETCFADGVERYDELAVLGGTLGTLPSHQLMGLLLAHAGRLKKYGA